MISSEEKIEWLKNNTRAELPWDKEENEAILKLLFEQAKQDDSTAQYILGLAYGDFENNLLNFAMLNDKNSPLFYSPVKSKEYLEKAGDNSKADMAYAQYQTLLQDPNRLQEAFNLLKKAGNNPINYNPDAAYELALLTQNGLPDFGIKKSHRAFVKLIKAAAYLDDYYKNNHTVSPKANKKAALLMTRDLKNGYEFTNTPKDEAASRDFLIFANGLRAYQASPDRKIPEGTPRIAAWLLSNEIKNDDYLAYAAGYIEFKDTGSFPKDVYLDAVWRVGRYLYDGKGEVFPANKEYSKKFMAYYLENFDPRHKDGKAIKEQQDRKNRYYTEYFPEENLSKNYKLDYKEDVYKDFDNPNVADLAIALEQLDPLYKSKKQKNRNKKHNWKDLDQNDGNG